MTQTHSGWTSYRSIELQGVLNGHETRQGHPDPPTDWLLLHKEQRKKEREREIYGIPSGAARTSHDTRARSRSLAVFIRHIAFLRCATKIECAHENGKEVCVRAVAIRFEGRWLISLAITSNISGKPCLIRSFWTPSLLIYMERMRSKLAKYLPIYRSVAVRCGRNYQWLIQRGK